MGRVFEIPLTGGLDEGVDRISLPQGRLSATQNVRLRRDGQLEVRPQYQALAMTSYGPANLVAYDVFNYNGRLMAMGDGISSGTGGQQDIFEYVNTSAAAWRGALNGSAFTTRIPECTNVRRVGSLPDQNGVVNSARLATNGTYICSVVETNAQTTVHVFDPRTDQTILLTGTPGSFPHVVFQGSDFWICTTTGTNVFYTRFNPLTNKTLQAGGTIVLADSCSDLTMTTLGTNWIVATCYGSTDPQAFVRNGTTGAAVTSYNIATPVTNRIAAAGNASGTLVTYVMLVATGYVAQTHNAAGTLQSGPTALFGGLTLSAFKKPTAIMNGATVRTAANVSNSTIVSISDVALQTITQSTHALSSTTIYADADLCSDLTLAPNGIMYLEVIQDVGGGAARDRTAQIFSDDNLIPQAFVDGQLATGTSSSRLNGSCTIGSKVYLTNLYKTEDVGNSGVSQRAHIHELETSNTARRQVSCIANEVYIAGGNPLEYDGRVLSEHGFAEKPYINSITQSAAGSLTLLGTYSVQTVWEVFDSRESLLHSAVSDPVSVTLTGVNSAITVVSSTPHSLRRHPALALAGGLTVRVTFYRTDSAGGNFFFDKSTQVASTDPFGQPVAVTLTQNDTALRDNQVIYTQSQTPINHVAPPPYQFTWPARERQLLGGLPQEEQWHASELLFPNEPVEFAGLVRLGFSGRAPRAITAVASFENAGLIWTKTEIAQITGRGPEYDGTGDFDPIQKIPSPGGCQDWRSLVATPQGFFFQMTNDQLMLLNRGGEVSFAGKFIQNTLAAFPVIVGAVHIRSEQTVAFACNNLAGEDARIIVYDMHADQWYVDTVGAALRGITELDGRIVYVTTAGVVFLQDSAIALSGALPTVSIATGSFRLFSAMGYGDLIKIGFLGTYLGDCTVEAFISYDDTKTWTSLGQQTVTAAALGLSADSPVSLIFTPNVRQTDRFAIRFDVTNATNTGGVRLHILSLEAESQEFTTRQPARNQR